MTAYLDLFSGIGGFALGVYWAGLRFDEHYFSEVDKYAIQVYKQRFPHSIALGDIREIKGKMFQEKEWIITGGFPCQDISVAGKGAGLAGERSGLWFEYARIISELRPRYAIMENVGALTFRGIDAVLGSLSEIGYDAEWQDIRASDVGAPHKRERIWIVAYPGGSRSGSESGDAHTDRRRGAWGDESPLRQTYRQDGTDRANSTSKTSRDLSNSKCVNDDNPGHGASEVCRERSEKAEVSIRMADTDCKRFKKQPDKFTKKTENVNSKIGGTFITNSKGSECAGVGREARRRRSEPGCSSWWAAEPDVGRVAHGVSSRVDRLKCIGNSIVPEIAELIFMQSVFDEWRIA